MGRQSPSACRVIHSARLRFARSFLKSVFSAEWPCQAARECFLSSLPRVITWTTGSRPLLWCVCCLVFLVKQTPQRHETSFADLETLTKARAGTVVGAFLAHGVALIEVCVFTCSSWAFWSCPCACCPTFFSWRHGPWIGRARADGVVKAESRAPHGRRPL